MMAQRWQRMWPKNQKGFTILEILVAIIILPIVVAGVASATNSIRQSYALARQYNEIYTVLSACPELDRALEYNSLSSTTNCYPNNSFAKENGQSGTISYSPSLSVTDTASLGSTDPLKTVPDSKVVSISVNFPAPNASRPALQLRMLITRSGIGQQ
jgi:prepilin-type N-terminal cleavage/methylation domain-containing protein